MAVSMLEEKTVTSPRGTTHYWVSKPAAAGTPALVFLPGLTADHRLFEGQVAHFAGRYPLLVWDAPGHGKSRPYADFTYENHARELESILDAEGLSRVVLVGQSAGGFTAQLLIARRPGLAAGLFTIGSCPCDPVYYSASDRFWLNQTEWILRAFPDKTLRRAMARACGATEAARQRMLDMLAPYGKKELCRLMALGFAGFVPEMRAVDIPCPVWLTVGEQDKTGKVRQYNEAWSKRAGYPLHIIPGAAHNANDDRPELINNLLERFLPQL